MKSFAKQLLLLSISFQQIGTLFIPGTKLLDDNYGSSITDFFWGGVWMFIHEQHLGEVL
jgi:hypothetical protein